MPQSRSFAFTLLETLLVLSLMVFIMGIIWGMMRLYSGNYLATEKRVSRAQLVRSIAEMLRDDLDAAIQDPIHPLLEKSQGSVPIRRFGLRGTSRSVQFDAVQNTPFLSLESPKEKERKKGQVPELKTIIYEFIPPYEREKKKISSESPDPSLDAVSGSQMVGSLQAVPENSGLNSSSEMEPLVRKYGLSRRELDFETVFTENSPGMDSNLSDTKWLEAKDLVMGREDNVDWAPEVLDCRFEYFDGSKWTDHWDSIEMGGLPVAIGVSLKLFSLDEIEQLRTHPLFVRWSEEKIRLKDLGVGEKDTGSRIVGSLGDPNANRSSLADELPDLQDILKRIGLPDPMDRQVVSWIPTTSLKNHQIVERRKPISVKGEKARSFNAFESVERRAKGERKEKQRREGTRFPDFASPSFQERTRKDRTYRKTDLQAEDVFSSLNMGSEEKSDSLPLENYRPAQQEGATAGQTWIRGK
ncbi:MAG: hypothetical protein Q4G69_14250 [Planctomycetia bacterium]|nr:hypothetical protein [Planctomycetia bacterium]